MSLPHERNGHTPPAIPAVSSGCPNAYTAVLDAARAVLTLAGKRDVTVAASDGLTVAIGAGEQRRAPKPAPTHDDRLPEPRERRLETIHQRLLAKATLFEEPIPTDVLIRNAGYKVNSWSRDKVTDLCTWGDLYRHPRNRGVSLPPGAEAKGGSS